MGDFSDKSSEARHTRIPIVELLDYIEEIRVKERMKPPRRFRTDPNGLKLETRSLSTTRVRQRLCDLMGTDVIRLNDKRYFQKLSERLQDEYEQTMDKQEDARSAAEEQRIRRLMLEGVIKTPDDYRAVVQGNRTKKPAKKKKKRKSKKRNSDGTPSSVDGTSTGMSHHSDEDKEEPDLVTQVSITSGSRPGSSVPSSRSNRPGSAVRPQSRTQSQSGTHSQSPSPSRPVHYEQENEDSDEDEGFDTKSLPAPSYDRPPSKFSRHENELVKTLRQEETVAGLYSLAEELVSPVKTDELVGKVKVIVKPTKKKMKQQF